jgi:enterochelin esterase-like enzyme/outer membrane protein assembly factor BamB
MPLPIPERRRSGAWMLLLAALLLTPAHGLAEDWVQWGGPNGDFTVEVSGLAEWWPANGPRELWKRLLGEGYSSILAKGDTLYTMYRDGEEEVVIALNAADGATRWEHRYPVTPWPEMTPAFGSGPNATPLILGDRILSVSIDGQLRCLDLASGKLLWKHDLPAEYGRRERDEEYGYSASPLEYQGRALVLVGGTDHAVVAFDPADGSTVWKSAPGGISYAAPTLTTLGGKDQFLYFSPQGVVGLEPSTGRQLWHHPMEYNNGNHLTPMVKCDEEHIWVGSQFPTGGGRLLEIKADGGTWASRQLWFETYLRASHWTNIRLGDFIYGSTGGNNVSILTAFNWRTGEIAWRKRGFHKAQALYADGKLLFLDEDGSLVLARVSPEGLEVLDKAQVTEGISWPLPTLVDTRLYLRDKTHIIALDLAHSGGTRHRQAAADQEGETAELLGELGAFVKKVQASEDKKGLLDAFFDEQDFFPMVEEDSLVHFVFRGDVPDIGVTGNFLESGQVDPMHLVEGTDFYFRSYRLPPASHFEYNFVVFDDRMPDPRNPRRLTPSGEGPSVLTTAGWVEPSHLREPDRARGQLDSFSWQSAILENERTMRVYLPPGYASSQERYPVIIINYGDAALEQGLWAHSLDHLIGHSVAPVIAVFLPRVDFAEYAPRVKQFSDAVAGELVPYLDEHYRTLPGPENRAMAGIASGGFASVFVALKNPGIIGKVAVQSFYFRSEAQEELRSLLASGDAAKTAFYIEWSTHDFKGGDELQSEQASRELASLVKKEDYRLVTNEVNDGAGWGSWRLRNDRILETFFPVDD